MASQAMSLVEKLLQELNGEQHNTYHNGEHHMIKFSTYQCKSLQRACLIVSDYLKLWRACSQLRPPQLALEELECLIQRARKLLHLCKDEQSWLLNAAIRLNNSREFAAICFGLSKLTRLINSQMILAAGDYISYPEVQALMCKPLQQNELFAEDLESTMEALNPAMEVDKMELLLKARALPKENMLRSYLLKKLEGTLPVIEPLELKDMIGGGAFGTVFRAEWMQTRVAVKEFREGDISFDKELSILKALMLEPDPNVLQIIGYYQKDDKAYLVMELMDSDLAKVIRKNHSSLQLTDMIDIMLQIASGMLFLHERNVVHRDLKPSNILLETPRSRSCFRVRLTDFGLSRTNFVSFAPDLTCQRGTLFYMAPEMFRGQKYSREVDVYSFGITCFQLLTGTLPFQTENGTHLVAQKLVELIEAGNRPDLPMNCPKELATLITRCWNTNPKDRPKFQSITRILSSVKEKLLISNFRELDFRDVAGDDFASIVADLVDKICITDPYVNVLQCSFVQSTCMQVCSYLGKLELPSAIVSMRKLVATLRSALALVESYTRESWMSTALIKLHNPRQFRMIVEDVNWCIRMLESETKIFSFKTDSNSMTWKLLARYAEEDKVKMLETTREIASGSLKGSGGVNKKLAEYLVKMLTTGGLLDVEPEELVLQNVLGMSSYGAVFRASWLGTTVTVKRVRMDGKIHLKTALIEELKQVRSELKNYHPNLPSTIGYTKHGEELLFLVEYTNAGVLRLTGKPFPPLLATEILLQIAQTMKYLRELNLDFEDFNTLLVDFEKTESEGLTGGLYVKLSTYSSSFKRLNPHHKHKSIHKFADLCYEMITGKAIEADTLLSERLPKLTPDCLQLLLKRCSSSNPPDFQEIAETLRSAKMELERNSPGCGSDYRRMLLEFQGSPKELNELELMGHGIVGEKLLVIVNMERAQNRLYQWVRQHRDGTMERLKPFLVSGTEFGTLEYRLTADDFDKSISLNFVNMNEKIEMAGRATTNSRWITCSEEMKRAIKNAWDAGAVSFKVTTKEDNKKCYLVMTRSYFIISSRRLLVRTIKEKAPFSSAALIKISGEEEGVCSLINGASSRWNVRFKDSSTRDFAVLTFRHFTKMNSFSRRLT